MGQLFNLFERDLDSMEEDLGTWASDILNAGISCGDVINHTEGHSGDISTISEFTMIWVYFIVAYTPKWYFSWDATYTCATPVVCEM